MSLVLAWTYCTLLLEPHRYYKFKIEKAKIHCLRKENTLVNSKPLLATNKSPPLPLSLMDQTLSGTSGRLH